MASVRPNSVSVGGVAKAKTLRPESEASALRDDLTTLLAHDLNTPLAAIAMNLDFALSELEKQAPDSVRGALEDCRHANARAIGIVSDMADAVRLALGDYRVTLASVDPGPVLAGVARRAADDATAREVRIAWSADRGTVVADATLLGRALDRLLERALRQARADSAVTLECAASTISIVAHTTCVGHVDPARAIATHFAEAALRAQGGHVQTQAADGALVYRVKLAAPRRISDRVRPGRPER